MLLLVLNNNNKKRNTYLDESNLQKMKKCECILLLVPRSTFYIVHTESIHKQNHTIYEY